MAMIPLGPLAPDDPSLSPHLSQAQGVTLIPDAEFGVAYGPSLSFSALSTSTAVSGLVRGSLTAVTKAGIYILFVCTATTIVRISSAGVPTVIGSGYNLPAGDKWSCCQMYDKAYFTNKNDGILQYDVELGGAVTAVTGAPKARVIRPIFDVLMALDCDGDNKLMQNSDYDPSNWTSGVANNQPFPEATELVGIEALSDNTALIFQRDKISIITKRGDALLFDKSKMIEHEGPVSPWCIVPALGAVYYIGTSGAKKATAGGVEPIGLDKIDHTWIAGQTSDNLVKWEGAFDPDLEMIRWRFSEDANGFSTDAIDYFIRVSNFAQHSYATALQALFTAAAPGLTMEDLDAIGTMDSAALNVYSLDDRHWFGGLPELAAVDSNGLFGFFSGTSEAVTLWMKPIDVGTNGLLTSLRPITDCSVVDVIAFSGTNLTGYTDGGTIFSQQPSGRIPVRARGRYQSPFFTIAAGTSGPGTGGGLPFGWTYFRAIDNLVVAPGGQR